MSDVLEPLFVRRVRGPISSSPLLVDANNDGWPEIFVGGPVLQGLTHEGESLPRWPKKTRKPFASSPAFGDIRGDGRGAIVVGCDDGRVHAFHADGDPVQGWPVRTGADVFSTPALADLDADNALEVIVGSDDGALYALRGDGSLGWTTLLPGRPFVSASPTVADFDGDGFPEVVVGAWDRALRAWSPQSGERPRALGGAGHVIWSSATAFELKGAGRFLAWAADRVYVTSASGDTARGWPRRTESWMVSSPAVVELSPGEGPNVVIGAERLYAWDLHGQLRPGWPVGIGDFGWSSPIALDVDGDGAREVIIGSWDGGIYAFRPDGTPVSGFPLRTEGPIFASPAAAPLPDGGGLLVAASWDGSLRGWRLPSARFTAGDWLQFRGSPSRTGVQNVPFEPPHGAPLDVPELVNRPVLHRVRIETWAGIQRAVVEGDDLAQCKRLELSYAIQGERKDHPVPVVNSRGRFVAIFQPLRTPHRIRYHAKMERADGSVERWPREGAGRFRSKASFFRLAESLAEKTL